MIPAGPQLRTQKAKERKRARWEKQTMGPKFRFNIGGPTYIIHTPKANAAELKASATEFKASVLDPMFPFF